MRRGCSQARAPDDQGRLARLVAEALPTSSAVPVSGSMLLGRAPGVPPLVMHVKPVGVPPPDYGARPVAALVLLIEPGHHPRVDPAVVARTLGLTPAESQVAGLVGGGQERARHGHGHGSHGKCHLLAPEADLPETANLPAGGPGAVGAVDRRVRLTGDRRGANRCGKLDAGPGVGAACPGDAGCAAGPRARHPWLGRTYTGETAVHT